MAFIISQLGYDIGITIGRAKVFDMVALATTGKSVHIQVKCTFYYDWLVHGFSASPNSVVALVRLGKNATQKPELYFLPGRKANEMIIDKHKNYSPYIHRAEVLEKYQDHDFELIERLLGK